MKKLRMHLCVVELRELYLTKHFEFNAEILDGFSRIVFDRSRKETKLIFLGKYFLKQILPSLSNVR